MKLNIPKKFDLPILGLMAFSALSNDKIKETEQVQIKPNILIIIPEDFGWSDVGFHGLVIKTSNIDKLAEAGIRARGKIDSNDRNTEHLLTGLYQFLPK